MQSSYTVGNYNHTPTSNPIQVWAIVAIVTVVLIVVIFGEVAQWLGHRIANRKVSSSSPALPTVLRVRL